MAHVILNMTEPETRGLHDMVEVQEDGRHRLPLKQKDVGVCEICRTGAELTEDGDIKQRATYYARGNVHTTGLCLEHWAEQPGVLDVATED